MSTVDRGTVDRNYGEDKPGTTLRLTDSGKRYTSNGFPLKQKKWPSSLRI